MEGMSKANRKYFNNEQIDNNETKQGKTSLLIALLGFHNPFFFGENFDLLFRRRFSLRRG